MGVPGGLGEEGGYNREEAMSLKPASGESKGAFPVARLPLSWEQQVHVCCPPPPGPLCSALGRVLGRVNVDAFCWPGSQVTDPVCC